MNYVHSFSSFSTDNLDKARQFYGETMGLETADDEMGILHVKLAGGSEFIIYPKDDHVPATFTVMNFVVEDLEGTVDELTAKGVSFEHYNNEYMKADAKGIVRGGPGPGIAWFKDPAGNVLSVIEATKNDG